MRALIIDDEPLARRELRRLLAPFRWIEIVGEASNVDNARDCTNELLPDVLFLDVQMPGGSGFDLLDQLDRVPSVIFTTAYDHYAVKAFDVSAFDYLLKPVEPDRLAAALAKLHTGMEAAASSTAGRLEQLFVRDGPRCWFVPLREVALFTAEGNYVRLQWGTAHPLLGRSLAALEARLEPQRFFRANRRQIVNLEFVAGVELGEGGRLHMQLRDGPEIEISRRQARILRTRTTI